MPTSGEPAVQLEVLDYPQLPSRIMTLPLPSDRAALALGCRQRPTRRAVHQDILAENDNIERVLSPHRPVSVCLGLRGNCSLSTARTAIKSSRRFDADSGANSRNPCVVRAGSHGWSSGAGTKMASSYGRGSHSSDGLSVRRNQDMLSRLPAGAQYEDKTFWIGRTKAGQFECNKATARPKTASKIR